MNDLLLIICLIDGILCKFKVVDFFVYSIDLFININVISGMSGGIVIGILCRERLLC